MSNTPSDAEIIMLAVESGVSVRTGKGAVNLACVKQSTPPKQDAPADDLAVIEKEIADMCMNTPPGWRCTRKANHDGPCAATHCPEDLEFVAKGMERLRAADAADAAPQPSPAAQGDALVSEYRRGYRHGYEQRDAEVRGALA
jgi:hypothetical protein